MLVVVQLDGPRLLYLEVSFELLDDFFGRVEQRHRHQVGVVGHAEDYLSDFCLTWKFVLLHFQAICECEVLWRRPLPIREDKSELIEGTANMILDRFYVELFEIGDGHLDDLEFGGEETYRFRHI